MGRGSHRPPHKTKTKHKKKCPKCGGVYYG